MQKVSKNKKHWLEVVTIKFLELSSNVFQKLLGFTLYYKNKKS